MRLVMKSGVVDRADAAAPSRAGSCLNSSATTRRPAGQRRITADVMRPFSPRVRGAHTLPFQAHPRAGTECVLFPWRCSWWNPTPPAMQARRKMLRGPWKGKPPHPFSPLPTASSFRCPCHRYASARPSSASSGRHSPLSPRLSQHLPTHMPRQPHRVPPR